MVRHGQAGTRLEYDRLSALGWEQARRLAAAWRAAGREFTRVVAGGLRRQQETASAVAEALGVPVETQAGWNEFDLSAVYEGIAPQLARVDPDFREHYDRAQREIAERGADEHAVINRRWNQADELVVRAWVQGRFDYPGETWPAFKARIAEELEAVRGEGDVAVFTSATPIAISCGVALGLDDRRVFQLAGAQLNSAITELRLRHHEWRLFAFNQVPHLDEARWHTHR